MARLYLILALVFAGLTACAPLGGGPTIGSDGRPLPQVYRIRAGDRNAVQFRMLDSVNALRSAAGLGALSFDSRLNAAAATHARDMSVQNRPWNFGSDGSSPIDRVQRVGFDGEFLGENISESFETELETLAAWMDDPNSRRVLLDPRASRVGFAWHQESNGKIWWTLITGT